MNYYLGFKLGWFPNGGYVELTEDPVDWFYHLILPWTALAILFIGFYSRVLRSNVLDTINEDYVRTARAKGLAERQIMVRHVLRNSMIPIITLWGLDFGAVLGRRRDPHRDGVRPPGRRPVRGRVDRPARRAAGARHHAVRRVLHRAAERDRGHPLRLPRPADPAPVSIRAARAAPPSTVERPATSSFATEEGVVQAVDGVSFDLAAGRGAGGGGGVGLGQVRHRDDADGPDALAERALRGHRALQGHRADRRLRGRAAARARRGDRDDLPGPDDLAEPGA